MPNLINTDNTGNVFLNYINPTVKGEIIPLLTSSTIFRSVLETAYGAIGSNWVNTSVGYRRDASAEGYSVRLPAPGIETKTSTYRFTFSPWCGHYFYVSNTYAHGLKMLDFSSNDTVIKKESDRTFGLGAASMGEGANTSSFSTYFPFWVINDYSICMAVFSDSTLTTLQAFQYIGWLREPVYTGSVYPRGFTFVSETGSANNTTKAFTITSENLASLSAISSAADSITSPPIVCTPGTDPGDGSETATDTVIRDAAAPNNPVGKLWNCIDLPSSSVVGGLYKNTGNYDGDGSESEQDVYLCVMPWGTRKLGMRVWTENVV